MKSACFPSCAEAHDQPNLKAGLGGEERVRSACAVRSARDMQAGYTVALRYYLVHVLSRRFSLLRRGVDPQVRRWSSSRCGCKYQVVVRVCNVGGWPAVTVQLVDQTNGARMSRGTERPAAWLTPDAVPPLGVFSQHR